MKCLSIIISHFPDQKLENPFMSMKKTRNVQFNLMSMSNDILFFFYFWSFSSQFSLFYFFFLFHFPPPWCLLLCFLWFLCVYNTTFMISHIDLIAFSLIFLFTFLRFSFFLFLWHHFIWGNIFNKENSYFLSCCFFLGLLLL